MHGLPGTFRKSIIVFTILMAISMSLGYGSEPEFSEYEVKAAFMFNIPKFVEWPDRDPTENKGAIDLCVLGSDSFGSGLDQIAGKTVKGKRLLVKRIRSARDVKGCEMLFISGSEKERLNDIIETLKGTHILTIGDTSGYARRGVMINFYIDTGKVRFEINPDSTKTAGLVISAQLLKLAKIVKTE
jgi:hypothetical protein